MNKRIQIVSFFFLFVMSSCGLESRIEVSKETNHVQSPSKVLPKKQWKQGGQSGSEVKKGSQSGSELTDGQPYG